MKMLIMRGIPGSGKTTEAKKWADLVPGSVIVSADHYMYAGGQKFEPYRIEQCHEMCRTDCVKALEDKVPLVIVDNTNTKGRDLIGYIHLAEAHGYTFTILQVHVNPRIAFERCTHEVTLERIEHMGRRMWSERVPATWDVWNKGVPWRPSSQKNVLKSVAANAQKDSVEIQRRRS